MINKQVMRKHFSLHAETYDEYANVQKTMAAELMKMVKEEKLAGKTNLAILDIGCGTGFLTQMLCDAFPEARITAVDIAPGMIAFCQKKLKTPNVTFECADIEEAALRQTYDLIISNAAFQWFNSLGKTINKLYKALSGNGLLCFSTFGSRTFTELHQSYAKAKSKMGITTAGRPGPSFYNLPELLALCRDSLGEADPACCIYGKESLTCEYFASVKMFLESVKKIGANNSNGENRVNPSLIKKMLEIYERDFNDNGQIKATYHCLFLTIRKTIHHEC